MANQIGFMTIHALGTLGAHCHKAIVMKTRLACCIKVIHVFCNINVYVHEHFLVKNMNQHIVNRLQENVADLEQQVTNYTANDDLTLGFQ